VHSTADDKDHKMKNLILSLLLVSYSASVAQADVPKQSAVEFAVTLLGDVADTTSDLQLQPADTKTMMKEMAVKDGSTDAEEFDEYWVGKSSDAWGADSMSWGEETAEGAQDYIEGALAQKLEDSEQTDADKIAYANAMTKTKRAFEILNARSYIQYGVAPRGAVQCGVTFAELVILDAKTGKAYEIVMEGSGC
jgi:hypothetical protein